MPRLSVRFGLALSGVVFLSGSTAPAQTWNDARVRDLVFLATRRRVQQLADTGLADYRATARGYLTFLAQIGEGYPDPPKVIKTDVICTNGVIHWIDTVLMP